MSEQDALKRRDDELTMGDGEDARDEERGLEDEPRAGVTSHGVTSHDGLPRDQRGRVLGVWHVVAGPDSAARDRVGESWKALEGDLVDRAISLGCSVMPGRYEGAEIASASPSGG